MTSRTDNSDLTRAPRFHPACSQIGHHEILHSNTGSVEHGYLFFIQATLAATGEDVAQHARYVGAAEYILPEPRLAFADTQCLID